MDSDDSLNGKAKLLFFELILMKMEIKILNDFVYANGGQWSHQIDQSKNHLTHWIVCRLGAWIKFIGFIITGLTRSCYQLLPVLLLLICFSFTLPSLANDFIPSILLALLLLI